jgi:hypothetical protein
MKPLVVLGSIALAIGVGVVTIVGGGDSSTPPAPPQTVTRKISELPIGVRTQLGSGRVVSFDCRQAGGKPPRPAASVPNRDLIRRLTGVRAPALAAPSDARCQVALRGGITLTYLRIRDHWFRLPPGVKL